MPFPTLPAARRAHLQHLQLTGALPSGPVVVPGASLRASRRWLAVLDPTGRPVRRWRWAQVSAWTCEGIARDPSGVHRQVLELVVGGRTCRLLASAADLGPFVRVLARSAPAARQAADHAGDTGTAPVDDRSGAAPLTSSDAGRRAGPYAAGRRRWRARRRHQGGQREEAPAGTGDAGRRSGLQARRVAWSAAGASTAAVLVASLLAGAVPGLPRRVSPAPAGSRRANADLAKAFGSAAMADVHLARATAPPAPAPPAIASVPLAARESFGFLPYWALTDPSPALGLRALTTVAYFGVDVGATGAPVTSGPGWAGYRSQAFATLASEAHRHGSRVVLTLTCFDRHALDELTHSSAAQATLAATAVSLVRAENLDGVNLDLEGQGTADRAGLVRLVGTVAAAMHRADPGWQVTVDTYGSSAGDANGFYDVAALAREVDALVVMAYDMGPSSAPGPTAPDAGPGFTDAAVVAEYRAVVPAGSIILGLPLYGYDWPTTGPAAGDPATGPPQPVADDQVAPADTVYWDPLTGTPWAVYQTGGQWHQIWFDDAPSLAHKSRLAAAAGLRGVALWALGMASGTPADLPAALTGATAVATPPVGPMAPPGAEAPLAPGTGGGMGAAGAGGGPAAATGLGGPTAAVASGTFDGTTVSLFAWATAMPATTPTSGTVVVRSTTDSAMACLQAGPPLAVRNITGWPGTYLVSASAPDDCVTGTWVFVLASGGAGGAAGTTGSGGASGPGTAGEPGTGSAGGSGTAGTTGTTVSPDTTGTAGTTGTTGSPGVTGSSGTTGTAGTTGVTGSSGTTGTAGTTGSAGTAGTTGVTGSSGTTGGAHDVGDEEGTGSAGTTATPAAPTAPPAAP